MASTASVSADPRKFLSFRGIESFEEDREPNPDFDTTPGERFAWKGRRRRRESGVIDLSSAENTLMIDDLKEHISEKFAETLTDQDFQYGGPGGSDRLRSLLSDFMNTHFPFPEDRHIDKEAIVTTPGVYGALEQISYAVANPGDGILIGRPLYGGFIKGFTFSRSKVKVVAVDFEDEDDGNPVDPFSEAALNRYQNVFERSNEDGTTIKALVICNPHNPLGRCFSRDVLEKLVLLCCNLKIHLISDEIYAMSHFKKRKGAEDIGFTSVLALRGDIHPDQDSLVHCLYGMSKDFCCSGVRLGAVITRCKEIRNVIMTNAFLSWVSSGADIIWSCILSDHDFLTNFFKTNRERLSIAYQFLAGKLDSHGINYYNIGNAGLFIWIDLTYALPDAVPPHTTDRSREDYILNKLKESPGLLISSGLKYKTETLGWFRIVFSRPSRDLEEAVNRIVARLGTPNDPKR